MKKKIELAMGVLFLVGAFLLAREGAAIVSNAGSKTDKTCIVIDAGHGGRDPGKVGVNGVLEKDLNLAIALKLKKQLEKENIKVVLTRETEDGLYDEDTDNKKVQDMRRRCAIIEKAAPLFTISIHQNSYPQESVKGIQCFYFGQSKESKELAETLQQGLQKALDPKSKRTAKANESYYLLKKTAYPTVIVECGFLSNHEEATLLKTDDYQKKLAKAISDGILTYLGDTNDKWQVEETESSRT